MTREARNANGFTKLPGHIDRHSGESFNRVAGSKNPRSHRTTIDAADAESRDYQSQLKDGGYGLRGPGKTNAPGVDYVIIKESPQTPGKLAIVGGDTTLAPLSSKGTTIRPDWLEDMRDVVENAELTDTTFELDGREVALDAAELRQLLREAWESGEVYKEVRFEPAPGQPFVSKYGQATNLPALSPASDPPPTAPDFQDAATQTAADGAPPTAPDLATMTDAATTAAGDAQPLVPDHTPPPSSTPGSHGFPSA